MIIFDTETNGLVENMAIPLKRQPQIIELFALKLEDDWLREIADNAARHSRDIMDGLYSQEGILARLEASGTWHSLFHAKVDAEIEGITGITKAMLEDAPAFVERLDSLTQFFLGEEFLLGHNLAFDRDMLIIELRRLAAEYRFPWPHRHICTVEATEDAQGFRQSLSSLHEQLFGQPFQGAHRAKADVMATARVAVELIRQGRIVL